MAERVATALLMHVMPQLICTPKFITLGPHAKCFRVLRLACPRATRSFTMSRTSLVPLAKSASFPQSTSSGLALVFPGSGSRYTLAEVKSLPPFDPGCVSVVSCDNVVDADRELAQLHPCVLTAVPRSTLNGAVAHSVGIWNGSGTQRRKRPEG